MIKFLIFGILYVAGFIGIAVTLNDFSELLIGGCMVLYSLVSALCLMEISDKEKKDASNSTARE